MKSGGPYRVSDREVPIAITGYFMPTHERHVPVLLGMPGTDDLFIVVFSTEEKLVALMRAFDIAYERVAIVTSGRELMDEVEANNRTGTRPYRVRLAVDPYKTEDGRVRFSEPMVEETP